MTLSFLFYILYNLSFHIIYNIHVTFYKFIFEEGILYIIYPKVYRQTYKITIKLVLINDF